MAGSGSGCMPDWSFATALFWPDGVCIDRLAAQFFRLSDQPTMGSDTAAISAGIVLAHIGGNRPPNNKLHP